MHVHPTKFAGYIGGNNGKNTLKPGHYPYSSAQKSANIRRRIISKKGVDRMITGQRSLPEAYHRNTPKGVFF
jgi:hypothetical protein